MQAAATNDAPNLSGMTRGRVSFSANASDGSHQPARHPTVGSHRLLYRQVHTSASYSPLINFMGILPGRSRCRGKAVMRVVQ